MTRAPIFPDISHFGATGILSSKSKHMPELQKMGHSIEFCISPGGKMEGQSAFDAVTHQCMI